MLETGIYIVLGEVNLLLTDIKRNHKWSTHHMQSNEEIDSLVASLIKIKTLLNNSNAFIGIAPMDYLGPFLNVIRSEETSAPTTGIALTSVNKFLTFHLIDSTHVENATLAVESIANSITHARFVGTDPASDAIVLLKILNIFKTLLLSEVGNWLSNDSVCDILQSCFRICFEMRLNELLRKAAEFTLVDMVQFLFSRLPTFSDDLKAMNSNQRKLKMRSVGVNDTKSGRFKKKSSSKPKVISMDNKNNTKSQVAIASEIENYQCSNSDLSQSSSGVTDIENSNLPQQPSPLNEECIESSTNLVNENEVSETTSINIEESILRLADDEDKQLNERTEAQLEPLKEGECNIELKFEDEDSKESNNSDGILFLSKNNSHSEEESTLPYGSACIRELLLFLISMVNPMDSENIDTRIHMGLLLLTIALESAADHIPNFKTLMAIVQDDLCKNLILLLKCEKLSLFAATLRVCFILFESMRAQLKFQLEMYITRLMELVVSESRNVSNEHKEMVLDQFACILRIPTFITELYLNYDCNLYSSSLFEDLTKLLSKNAYPLSGLSSTCVLSLDALLVIIEKIEDNCSRRINKTSKLTTDNNSNSGRNLSLQNARLKLSETIPNHKELRSIIEKKKKYQIGIEQFNGKPQKGISYLQDHGLLSDPLDAGEVVDFIKQNATLDKRMIGEYMSNKKNTNILQAYQKSFRFDGTRIDEALRMYLETFRLPGEAPVISFILEQFAEHWHKSNGEPFENSDAAFTLAYAVIMLNVDQHNTNAKKQNIPMTNENFKKNLTKVNGGKDFDEKMLDDIYQAIKNDEIVMPAEQMGIVKDNYLWKTLLRRSAADKNEYLRISGGTFDRDLFSIVAGPTSAALAFIFDKSHDENTIQKVITGFRKCAFISSHYDMSEVFDNLVISLCKFTTLTSSHESSASLAISFGNNPKAQIAARAVFGLTHCHSDILHDGWKSILDCLLQLYRAKLLSEVLVKVEDFIDPSGRISLIKEDTIIMQKSESGVFNNIITYFSLTSDVPHSRGLSAEDEEAVKRAQDCILECHVEQIIMESKFLREDSLQQLIKALINGSKSFDSEDINRQGNEKDDIAVFYLEMLVKVILQNRDRISIYWKNIEDHFFEMVTKGIENLFLVERSVVGLLRIAVRLLRREDIAQQVLHSIRIFLSIRPEVSRSIAPHIAYGLHDVIKTNASSIHEPSDWKVLFMLLGISGAGAELPTIFSENNEAMPDNGAQSDSEMALQVTELASSDRGYTSDSEVYDTKNTKISMINQIRKNQISNVFSPLENNYSICLDMPLHPVGVKSTAKCVATLAFVVRDASHINTLNIADCINTIRVFSEAVIHADRFSEKTQISKSSFQHQKKKQARGKDLIAKKKLQSSPSHPNKLNKDSEDELEQEEYHNLTMQLLEMLHTLHTRALTIYRSWEEEQKWRDENNLPINKPSLNTNKNKESSIEMTDIWIGCWCPLLQGMARLCCDTRRDIRNHALTFLQRALLVHDLKVLEPLEWEDCFNKVLFPLLSNLLEAAQKNNKLGMEESLMRASALLCKVFLQHLTPLLSLSTFTALWLTILDFMDKYMHFEKSDLLIEAIPESLKNMLLVMETAGILRNPVTMDTDRDDTSYLWKLTWHRIDSFLPHLKSEVFKPHTIEPRKIALSEDLSESPHDTQDLNNASNNSENNFTDVTIQESIGSQLGELNIAANYILYPPVPLGENIQPRSGAPLLINREFLQSSSIPLLPQTTIVNESVTMSQPTVTTK